jgi:hypothetical protein
MGAAENGRRPSGLHETVRIALGARGSSNSDLHGLTFLAAMAVCPVSIPFGDRERSGSRKSDGNDDGDGEST